VQKKYLVKDIEKNMFVNLIPFPCKVPIEAFSGVKISVKGFEDVKKEYVLKDCVKIVGADLCDKAEDCKYLIFDIDEGNGKKMLGYDH